MVANNLPASTNGIDQGSFRGRYIRLRFSSKIPDLDEGRLIATLWGCIRRRVCNSPFALFSNIPQDVDLLYNEEEGYFIPNELDPENRSWKKRQMDTYMEFALGPESEETYFADYDSIKGIFYTRKGQCLECWPVRLVKEIENKQFFLI